MLVRSWLKGNLVKGASLVLLPLALTVVACSGGGEAKATATPEPPAATATAEGPTEMTAAEILEKNKTALVKIITNTPYGEGGGSGVVFEDDSHVLTNAHVVIGAGSIKVVDPEDSTKTFSARVVGLSPCDDVALLEVDRAQGLTPATFGDSDEMGPGDHVVSLGYPGTLTGRNDVIVTEGTVSRTGAEDAYYGNHDMIQNTAPINPGNSGGPLFNMYGEVIGLNSYSIPGAQSENYAVSSNEALSVAKELKQGQNIDYIGISLQTNYEDFAYTWDLPYIDGLVVLGVEPGSAADKADPYPLEPGYLIFDANDTPVYTVGDFCDVLRSQNSGATLRLRFGAYDTNDEPYNNYVVDVIVP